jgi:hypothetical protein
MQGKTKNSRTLYLHKTNVANCLRKRFYSTIDMPKYLLIYSASAIIPLITIPQPNLVSKKTIYLHVH